VTGDRLALATAVRKASRVSTCGVCGRRIMINESIARLTAPNGWCHLMCVAAERNRTERP
jgi:hypothetical protein